MITGEIYVSGNPTGTRTVRDDASVRTWVDKIAVCIKLSGGQPHRPTGRPISVTVDASLYKSPANAAGSMPISGRSMVLAQLIDAAIEALVAAGVIYDVRQVVQVSAKKAYGNPGIKITWE